VAVHRKILVRPAAYRKSSYAQRVGSSFALSPVITLTKEWRQWQPSRLGEDEIELRTIELRTIKEKDDPCHPTLRRIEAEVGNL
jgi:hypothetical protein